MRKIVFGLLLSAGFLMAEGWFVGASFGTSSFKVDRTFVLNADSIGYSSSESESESVSRGGFSLQGGYDFGKNHRFEAEYIAYAGNFDYFGAGYMYKHPIDKAITPFAGIGLGSAEWADDTATLLKLKAGGLYKIEEQHEIELGFSYAKSLSDFKSSGYGEIEGIDHSYTDSYKVAISRFYLAYNYHF